MISTNHSLTYCVHVHAYYYVIFPLSHIFMYTLYQCVWLQVCTTSFDTFCLNIEFVSIIAHEVSDAWQPFRSLPILWLL